MPTKVFISCSSTWSDRDQFEFFLTTLGFEPIIVDKQKDLGLNPNEKAQYYMDRCDKIIFIFTPDAVDKNGQIHPRSNVALELGWARDKFHEKDKIYILTENARMPSMINPSYIHLNRNDLFDSVSKIIKNLDMPHVASADSAHIDLRISENEKRCLEILQDSEDDSIWKDDLYKIMRKEYGIEPRDVKLIINSLIEGGFFNEGIKIGTYPLGGTQRYYGLTRKALSYLYELKKARDSKK